MIPPIPPPLPLVLKDNARTVANAFYGPPSEVPGEILAAANKINWWAARNEIRGFNLCGLMDSAAWHQEWAKRDKTAKDVAHWQRKYSNVCLEVKALRSQLKKLKDEGFL